MPKNFDRNGHVFRSPEFIKVVDEAVKFFIKSPPYPLPPPTRFGGAGVYALYYTGDFESYSTQSRPNQKRKFSQPIYAGKAVPQGWRQGRLANDTASTLFNRLREHSASIKSTQNLNLEHFYCRFVILEGQESNLISTIEAELIRKFSPIWNSLIDGFGNHHTGSGRYNQSPSEWDVLHPGRSWVTNLTGKPPTVQEILAKLKKSSS